MERALGRAAKNAIATYKTYKTYHTYQTYHTYPTYKKTNKKNLNKNETTKQITIGISLFIHLLSFSS